LKLKPYYLFIYLSLDLTHTNKSFLFKFVTVSHMFYVSSFLLYNSPTIHRIKTYFWI